MITGLARNTLAAAGILMAAVTTSQAQFGRMEFLVPGGRGSGQDQAARAFEEALKTENLVTGTQVTHYAGGGGMIAISQFLTTKSGNSNAVVTQGAGHLSFPLSNKTPVSLRDVTPLARQTAGGHRAEACGFNHARRQGIVGARYYQDFRRC